MKYLVSVVSLIFLPKALIWIKIKFLTKCLSFRKRIVQVFYKSQSNVCFFVHSFKILHQFTVCLRKTSSMRFSHLLLFVLYKVSYTFKCVINTSNLRHKQYFFVALRSYKKLFVLEKLFSDGALSHKLGLNKRNF